MIDIRNTVIEMLREPQLANLATITNDSKPWTRYVMVRSDNELTIRVAVSLDSRKVLHVKNNPEVHLTFGITNLFKDMNKPYVQLQGTAEVSDEIQEKHLTWFEMLNSVFDGPDDPSYGVMIIKPYRIEFINPSNMTPEIWEK